MWLSIGFHILAAASLAVMSAITLHFILLIHFLPGAVIGLLLYLIFLLFGRVADQNPDL